MRYEKDVPVLGDFDVVVCGAGVAGFCAAVQAARAGAKTALVERYGMPGGVLTVGGNNEIGLFYRGSRPIIAGIGWELVKRLEADGWAAIPPFSEEYDHSQQNVVVNGPMAARRYGRHVPGGGGDPAVPSHALRRPDAGRPGDRNFGRRQGWPAGHTGRPLYRRHRGRRPVRSGGGGVPAGGRGAAGSPAGNPAVLLEGFPPGGYRQAAGGGELPAGVGGG